MGEGDGVSDMVIPPIVSVGDGVSDPDAPSVADSDGVSEGDGPSVDEGASDGVSD